MIDTKGVAMCVEAASPTCHGSNSGHGSNTQVSLNQKMSKMSPWTRSTLLRWQDLLWWQGVGYVQNIVSPIVLIILSLSILLKSAGDWWWFLEGSPGVLGPNLQLQRSRNKCSFALKMPLWLPIHCRIQCISCWQDVHQLWKVGLDWERLESCIG